MEASDELFVAAPPHCVWQLLRRIDRWREWNPIANVLSFKPVLNPTSFCWKVSGIRFHSNILAERPVRTLRWRSVGRGIVAHRSWMLIPERHGTRVITHTEAEGLTLCIRPEATKRLVQRHTRQLLAALRRAAEDAQHNAVLN